MVTLPKEFVKTYVPGYFWHTVEKELYSIKSGELRPIKFHPGGHFFGRTVLAGYVVHVHGVRKKLSMRYLGSLKATDEIQEIGVRT